MRKLAACARKCAEDMLDFSANINPIGAPEYLRSVISRNIERLAHYPDPDCVTLAQAIAKFHSVPCEDVIVGNGSIEILQALPRVLSGARAVVPVPSYIDYARSAQLAGLQVVELPLLESNGFHVDFLQLETLLSTRDLVFLGQPNNPTGCLFDNSDFRRLAARRPSTTFVVDEAFAGFVNDYESLAKDRPQNVVVLRSMTKFYAIPGLRLGYALADGRIAEQIRTLLPPWSVNALAQAVGEAVISDTEYADHTREFVCRQRNRLAADLARISGLTVFPGTANFLLARMDHPHINARHLAERLLRQGIAIRVCDNFAGLDERYLRVAVRTPAENARLLSAIALALEYPVSAGQKRKTPAVMFQGTGSSVGKSVLTAAFCRILLQDGYRVAPFKAQNMSLNSFVTAEGGEMGRAQVTQAQACRIEPDVRMNPILLKPNSDTGCQVVVMGKPVGNMNVREYSRYKAKAFDTVKESFDALAKDFDVIVLEGAGSPAEVNLKHDDIVNLRMARHAESPVLLVGDIDRGGVFASFVGTMEVLAEWERRLVAGFVVNRFRGDPSLLDPAFEFVQSHTGRPVLGVVPYLNKLILPQEDSVEFKSGAFDDSGVRPNAVDVAIIDLPHISNFTDFDALRLEPGVRVRVVRTPAELEEPAAVIIPGSKNVIADLKYLREVGLSEHILRLAGSGKTQIVGICGGFQMLGKQIADPEGIESSREKIDGIGLLPVITVLASKKTLVRVEGTHLPSGLPINGYEIHHGQTDFASLTPIFKRLDGAVIGGASASDKVWGTYLHGIFDADAFRRWFVNNLRKQQGHPPTCEPLVKYDLDAAIDQLAEVVRASVNVKAIYKLMGLS